MHSKKLSPDGFHVVALVLAVAVVGVVGLVGYKVSSRGDKAPKTSAGQVRSKAAEQEVKWAFNQQKNEYFVESGTAPACKQPFVFDYTPVDLSQLNVVGMPGVYRGYSYKPHGGFRADNSPDGHIQVKMPMDATLVGLKRYYEGSPAELQYLLTFESDCGIAFRFDHLYTLAPAFQAIANTTPEPKLNDTRSDPNAPFKRTQFKARDTIATAVGFPRVKNFGFDFGVYDYRHRNQISKNPQWAALHNQYTSLEWFGVCWFDMLPGADAAKAKELANVVLNPQKPNANKISDYCPQAQYKTLDFNDGRPTDG